MSAPRNLLGQRFGRLTVERLGEPNRCPSGSKRRWACRCDCGGVALVCSQNLVSGMTKSCGCLRGEVAGDSNRTHGESHESSPEYRSWKHMRERCANPKNKKYDRYGGRGISVCERWRSFEAFLADMGRKPSPAHSIDRINNDGNYEPGNCRWATAAQQNDNTSVTRRAEFNGRILTLRELSAELGIKSKTLGWRLRNGWPLDAPLRGGGR